MHGGSLCVGAHASAERRTQISSMCVAMASITSALLAVTGEDRASVRSITDVLNANGFNCDIDMASGTFLGLTEGHLAALHLNIKQKAAVCAAQDVKRRRLHDGEHPRGALPSKHMTLMPLCFSVGEARGGSEAGCCIQKRPSCFRKIPERRPLIPSLGLPLKSPLPPHSPGPPSGMKTVNEHAAAQSEATQTAAESQSAANQAAAEAQAAATETEAAFRAAAAEVAAAAHSEAQAAAEATQAAMARAAAAATAQLHRASSSGSLKMALAALAACADKDARNKV